MPVPVPHFLLYSEVGSAADASRDQRAGAADEPGRWRFVLRRADGQPGRQEAADIEEGATHQRLELLAIVRGLESLDQPSRVTLVTGSRTVRSGLKYGLVQWRESGWQWERYGRLTPVKNGDLWRRIDRALEIHSLECAGGGLDNSDDLAPPAAPPLQATPPSSVNPTPAVAWRRDRKGRRLRIDPAPADVRITTSLADRISLAGMILALLRSLMSLPSSAWQRVQRRSAAPPRRRRRVPVRSIPRPAQDELPTNSPTTSRIPTKESAPCARVFPWME